MKRNITKAIYIADYLIVAHNKNAKGIEDLVKDWNSHNTQELGLEIASVHRAVAVAIGYIKELLEKESKEKKIVKASG